MKRPAFLTLAGGLGLVAALVGTLAVRSTEPAVAPAPTVTAKAPAAERATAVAPAPAAPVLARSEGAVVTQPTLDDVLAVEAPTEVLTAAIASDDAVIVAEAVNALVAREAHAALPTLLAAEVIERPRAAPSLIYGLGRLAANAEPADHEAAVNKLLALLAIEKKRGAQESQGNLLQIYEALGDTGSPSAIAALERELLDATVPTAPKVVVVQALVALHAHSSRGVLEQVAARVAPSPTDTSFEAELRRDLVTVIQKALVQLS